MEKNVGAQCMSGNTFLIAAVQRLWINMYHFYLHHFVYILTWNEASSQAHKTRQNFHMICNYQALCMSVWQVMKLLHVFTPILSVFFSSLPCCLLHSLWPILDLILTSSRERLFSLGILHSDFFFFKSSNLFQIMFERTINWFE